MNLIAINSDWRVIYVNEFSEYNVWKENFLGAFRQVSTDDDFKRLALFYPAAYTYNKCKQRKNNLLRNGNRNIYLDDLYAISRYSDKTPDNLLLGYNNIVFFWSELAGENLFSKECVERIIEALKSDKNYRTIYIPKVIEDFFFFVKTVVFEVNDKKIRRPIFNINDNSLDFKTTGKTIYSYTPNLFFGGETYDVLCDYVLELIPEDFPDCNEDEVQAFIETIGVYLDAGKSEAVKTDGDINFRIKNWVCNCTIWLLLSYISDTCERTGESVEHYFIKNSEVITFMLRLFVFGTKVIKQKRVTDEKTNEKKRIRYFAFLDCNGEKLDRAEDEYDYYDDIDYKTASFSDMQKSSLSDILNFELR